MGYTITEKILLRHAKEKKIAPGDFIFAGVDLALGNDITAPLAVEEFRKAGAKKIINNKRVVFTLDHFTPSKDIKSAAQCKLLREFVREQKIRNFFDIGTGVEHALLPEKGLVSPGDLVIGADSHTCTYGALGAFASGVGSTDLAAAMITGRVWLRVPESMKLIYYGRLPKWTGGKDIILRTIKDLGVDGARYKAMEFCGEAIENLPMEGRFTICNMAIEAGAKNGIIAPDKITLRYEKERKVKVRKWDYSSDPDAGYSETREYDVSKLEPQVACPFLPSNVEPVSRLKHISIDQAVIGSCTNGWLGDLRTAAGILRGKKVHPKVRLIVIPATREIYLKAMKEGLIETFIKAGAAVSTPTCGPCLGGHMGVLAEGERAVSTTNRNFLGRMGHVKSEVYLSNPAVAAASAVKGRLAHPGEV